MKLKINTYDSLDNKLFAEWESVWKKSKNSHMYNSPYWYKACTETLGDKKQLIVVCRSMRNTILGIIPLVGSSKYGFRVYLSPGGIYLDKSTVFLNTPSKAAVLRMIREVSIHGDFYITEVSENQVIVLRKGNPKLGISTCSRGRELEFDNNPFRFINHECIRRIRKRIRDNKFSISFKLGKDSFSDTIKIIREIENESSKQVEGKEVFSDSNLVSICSHIQGSLRDSLIVSLLYLNDEPVGYKYGFIVNNTYHYCNTAFKTKYGNLSPGKVMMFLTLDELVKRNVTKIDFSRGDTQFKKEFTPFTYQQYSIFYFKNPFYMQFWKLAYRLKPILESHEKQVDSIKTFFNKSGFIKPHPNRYLNYKIF